MRRFFAVSLAAATLATPPLALAAVKFQRGPYLQDLGSRGVSVLAGLDDARRVRLEVTRGAVGPDGTPDHVAKSATSATAHELNVTGLQPATSYRYRFVAEDGAVAAVERGTFTTAPEDDRAISFLLYGDNRTNIAPHAAIVKLMRAAPGDFLVHTGDLVYDGSDPNDWLGFFSIERELLRDRCIFPALGNHDIGLPTSDGVIRYATLFRVPAPLAANERWYTFRWGIARFFMLDAQDEFATGQRDWLESALKASDTEPGVSWRFVAMHHGPWSSGLHGGNRSAIVARIPELLRAHKIDVVLSGHDHVYERGEAAGQRYVISGGAGAPLYPEYGGEPTTQKFESVHHYIRFDLTKTEGVMTAIRIDASVIERCAFVPGGAGGWSCGAAAVASAIAPVTNGGRPPRAQETPETRVAPLAKRTCGCGALVNAPEWLGFVLLASVAAGAALRRRG